MRPALTTVLSARAWEPHLAQVAADSGLVRLVGRAYSPGDVPHCDIVVVGTETPWLTPARIAGWHRTGLVVFGVFPLGDRAAVDLLCRARADQLFEESVDPIVLMRAARDMCRDIPAGRRPRY